MTNLDKQSEQAVAEAEDISRLCDLVASLALLRKVLEPTLAHLEELADAWMRGCLTETDGQGGTRSNRNHDIAIQVRNALEAVCR
jgi:hypothetical protein